ncbi:MAG: glycosyltransferase family A protein [Victivallaceae bacterium]|nr:glycosyltransferase family A protein [Victivallaceae bacterium]
MLHLPLVSIIITNYNYSRYVIGCLESIARQTYRPLECIVIDDKSTDNSVKVIEKFISGYPAEAGISFRLLKQKKNSGQLAGFMRGIREAKGVFITFVDADDILLPDFINIHVQVHFATNVALTCSRHIEIDENDEIQSCFSLISEETRQALEFSFSPDNYEM